MHISILKNKFLQILPWLNTRAEIIFLSFFELFLSFFIFSVNTFSVFPNNSLIAFILSIIFVLLSYISGRYNYLKTNYRYQLILNIAKSIIVFFLFIFFVYLYSLIFNIEINFLKVFTLIILNLSIFNFLQFTKLVIKNKKIKNQPKWIFVGNIKTFNYISEQARIGRTKKKIFYIDSYFKENLLWDDFEGVIFEDLNSLKKGDLKFLENFQKKQKPILNLFNWCELYLQRIPTNILIERDILRYNFYFPKYSYQQRIKFLIEIILSITLLTLLSPIIIISCFLIWITDKGPVFYSQIRVGKKGKHFRIWKLRSMHVNAEKNGIKWSSINDERITFIGKIIRRIRIDELPQLFSVIKGDMSLIGPRPERPEIEDTLKKQILNYKIRQIIKPGISGWAQVNYPYGASIEDSNNKLSYDLFYVKNMSIFLDLLIFIKTIKTILNLKNSLPNR
tara:strand:+ start:888 stop:2237 length:1350 start_codon:yes stop_codon:yes gene_type:complete